MTISVSEGFISEPDCAYTQIDCEARKRVDENVEHPYLVVIDRFAGAYPDIDAVWPNVGSSYQ